MPRSIAAMKPTTTTTHPSILQLERIVSGWSGAECNRLRAWARDHVSADDRKDLGAMLRPGKADAGVPANWRRRDLARAALWLIERHGLQLDQLAKGQRDDIAGTGRTRGAVLAMRLQEQQQELEEQQRRVDELERRVASLEARAFRDQEQQP